MGHFLKSPGIMAYYKIMGWHQKHGLQQMVLADANENRIENKFESVEKAEDAINRTDTFQIFGLPAFRDPTKAQDIIFDLTILPFYNLSDEEH